MLASASYLHVHRAARCLLRGRAVRSPLCHQVYVRAWPRADCRSFLVDRVATPRSAPAAGLRPGTATLTPGLLGFAPRYSSSLAFWSPRRCFTWNTNPSTFQQSEHCYPQRCGKTLTRRNVSRPSGGSPALNSHGRRGFPHSAPRHEKGFATPYSEGFSPVDSLSVPDAPRIPLAWIPNYTPFMHSSPLRELSTFVVYLWINKHFRARPFPISFKPKSRTPSRSRSPESFVLSKGSARFRIPVGCQHNIVRFGTEHLCVHATRGPGHRPASVKVPAWSSVCHLEDCHWRATFSFDVH